MQAEPKVRARYVVNASGTRYVKTGKDPVPRPRIDQPLPSKALEPFIKGEAAGDVDLAVLLCIRNTIMKPSRYVHDKRAADRENKPAEPLSEAAVRWSIFGALSLAVDPLFTAKQKRDVLDLIKRVLPAEERGGSLFHWEEARGRKHSHVIHLLNMAIAARKQELGYSKK
jgi:hypothetical protein